MNFRIGHSTDIHQLVEGRKLILGGVKIEYEKGLLGHSDADCLLHSISEAIIGALGLGDLGTHFSDKDNNYLNISSSFFLKRAKELMVEHGYAINNIDCTIFAQEPLLAKYIPLMKMNISSILEIDASLINIKATRGEKIGFVGRKEGISAETVLLLVKDK